MGLPVQPLQMRRRAHAELLCIYLHLDVEELMDNTVQY